MTETRIVSKKTTKVVETVYIAKDETIESLIYWVHVALSARKGNFAQFQHSGSTYVVSIDD